MIPKETEANILRLYEAEKWRVGTIAKQLGIHRDTVKRVLAQAGGVEVSKLQRQSMVDPYIPFINSTLEKYPRLRASRLHQMVKERGYTGGEDHFRHMVAQLRPKPSAEAFLRLRTLPGEQAQVDWAHFGRITVGNAVHMLTAFVMVLSWSRRIFCRFYLNMRMENFLRGHVCAFDAFGGIPRILLYDNLKSVVLERDGAAIRLNPKILDFAAHYRFEVRPVAVARGNEKGRVERAIRYARDSFFGGREYVDLDDLNLQAQAWCTGLSSQRPCPEDRTLTVGQALEVERPRLLRPPPNPYNTHERVEVTVGKTPYVRFEGNDYSVPHTRVRRSLTVVASLTEVRLLDGLTVVAEHRRCFSTGDVIEEKAHIAALVAQKQQARRHRGMDRLRRAVPVTEQLLCRLAERGDNIGSAVSMLLRLLDRHGASELTQAVDEALEHDNPHPQAVRLILDRRLRERNLPPPVAVELPDDPRVRDLVVKPQTLSDYDYDYTSTEDDNDES